MKHVALTIAPFLFVGLFNETSPAQEADRPRERPSFDYGGAPEFDRPPLARNDAEKRALAALEKLTQGKWYLNVTTREGRVLRQLTEAVGAKRVVEIGTSSGYSTIWHALGVRATEGKVFTHEIDPEKVKIARANFERAGVVDRIPWLI